MSRPQPSFEGHARYVLRLADGSLVLGQRMSEWCGHAPVLEEDIAFANLALDLIGQARLLLTHAGGLEGRGRDEDALAFWRESREFLNPTLVELPNGDFAQSCLRAYLYAEFQALVFARLAEAGDAALAAIAAKSGKETRYHREHLGGWVVRLGDGSDESHARMQRALDYLHPYVAELLEPDALDAAAAAAGVGPDLTALAPVWQAAVRSTLEAATLVLPDATPFRSTGKQGRHSEHMDYLVGEMQSVARAHPGASW